VSFFSGGGASGDRNGRKGPTSTRIAIWVVVAGVGLYLIISGLIGVVGKG
jgi:hypothetical protein